MLGTRPLGRPATQRAAAPPAAATGPDPELLSGILHVTITESVGVEAPALAAAAAVDFEPDDDAAALSAPQHHAGPVVAWQHALSFRITPDMRVLRLSLKELDLPLTSFPLLPPCGPCAPRADADAAGADGDARAPPSRTVASASLDLAALTAPACPGRSPAQAAVTWSGVSTLSVPLVLARPPPARAADPSDTLAKAAAVEAASQPRGARVAPSFVATSSVAHPHHQNNNHNNNSNSNAMNSTGTLGSNNNNLNSNGGDSTGVIGVKNLAACASNNAQGASNQQYLRGGESVLGVRGRSTFVRNNNNNSNVMDNNGAAGENANFGSTQSVVGGAGGHRSKGTHGHPTGALPAKGPWTPFEYTKSPPPEPVPVAAAAANSGSDRAAGASSAGASSGAGSNKAGHRGAKGRPRPGEEGYVTPGGPDDDDNDGADPEAGGAHGQGHYGKSGKMIINAKDHRDPNDDGDSNSDSRDDEEEDEEDTLAALAGLPVSAAAKKRRQEREQRQQQRRRKETEAAKKRAQVRHIGDISYTMLYFVYIYICNLFI